ncbi:MAG: trans-sulfuration enzyme family protein [Fimbriimonas sp.]
MTSGSEHGPSTRIAHFGEEEKIHGAVVPPIFQNSLFLFDQMDELLQAISAPAKSPPHHYSRLSNPTVDLAAQKIAMLEGAEAGKVMGSGMGAISLAVLSCVRQGSHVITVDTAYKPLRNMLSVLLPRFGVTHTLVDGRNKEEILDAVRPETSLIYLEPPSSLVFRMQDVAPIAAYAREKGISTVLDNTYSTPLHFQPLSVGVDLVCHSASKYLGGHSDITAGAVVGSRKRIEGLIQTELDIFGSHLAPFPAWLLTRGMRSLKVRLQHHEASANAVAAWLESRPEVEVVHHLGLPSYAQRDLVEKYMSGTGGLFSFEPKVQDPERIKAFCDALTLFGRGVSWGGFESLVIALPMSASGYESTRWFVRLYCGLEETEDLIRDLEQAMAHLE